jgi:lysophospholipase L1-like esterase
MKMKFLGTILFVISSSFAHSFVMPENHVFSMSFKVTSLNGELKDAAKREALFSWLSSNRFSRVYLESYRHGESVPTELLKEYKRLFEERGFSVAGLITPTSLNTPAKKGERAPFCVCWGEEAARERLAAESFRVASLFNCVIIDDFLFSVCNEKCLRCSKEKERANISDWGEFRRAQMLDVSNKNIYECGLKANASVKFIIKFPCWYRLWEERGYSPRAQAELFGGSWVGTETRDANPDPLQACWIVEYAQEKTGNLCLGGWYDALDCTPEKFIEQARYTILGGAKESLVHCYDYLLASDPGVTPFGEKSSSSRVKADMFAASSQSLYSLASRLLGVESVGYRMLPSGVSVHRFRRENTDFEIRLNTTEKTAEGIEPHAMRIDDPLFADGDTVVFFGDSITHSGRYHEFITDYYITRFPNSRIKFVNSGVGGDTSYYSRIRIEDDIVPYSPTHVVFHFGMNDVDRGLYIKDMTPERLEKAEKTKKAYERNFASLVENVRKRVPQASFIYMTPTPYDDTAQPTNIPPGSTGWAVVNQVGCNAALEKFALSVKNKAHKDNVLAIDMMTPMKEVLDYRRRTDPHFMLTSWDRVHPREAGHAIMAWTFLMSQGAPSTVSDVAVDAAAKSVVYSKNAQVSLLGVSTNSISFVIKANSIPFPIPHQARNFIKQFDVERRLNKEELRVSGLSSGEWDLYIDSILVGTYSAAELSKGILLGFNEKTPQYRQAQKVFKAQQAISERESNVRNAHYARWSYGYHTNVDDIPAFRKWAENKENKEKGGFCAKFIPEYCEYWPKHESVRASIFAEKERVRKMAEPVARHYRLERSKK